MLGSGGVLESGDYFLKLIQGVERGLEGSSFLGHLCETMGVSVLFVLGMQYFLRNVSLGFLFLA